MDLSESNNQIKITETAKTHLLETAKWGKFMAITGFVMCGIMVLAGIFMGTIFSTLMSSTMVQPNETMPNMGYVMTVMYVTIAIIYFFPCLYLYKFSTKTKIALENSDSEVLAVAFENQKSIFKFMGIFTIVILVIYGMIFFVALIGGGIAALMH